MLYHYQLYQLTLNLKLSPKVLKSGYKINNLDIVRIRVQKQLLNRSQKNGYLRKHNLCYLAGICFSRNETILIRFGFYMYVIPSLPGDSAVESVMMEFN